jgi:hypothetical protein
MRKTLIASAIGLAAGLAAPTQQDGDLATRVDGLATQLAVTRTELTAAQARLGEVETYLQKQAASVQALGAAAQASDEAGFTAGINPKSREILLDALRAQAKAAEASVPGGKPSTKSKGR